MCGRFAAPPSVIRNSAAFLPVQSHPVMFDSASKAAKAIPLRLVISVIAAGELLTTYQVVAAEDFYAAAGPPPPASPAQSREPAVWEEPSLFPGNPEPAASGMPQNRSRVSPPLQPSPTAEAFPDSRTPSQAARAATAFQTNFGMIDNSIAPAVGLSASREEEMLRARTLADRGIEPYNIKLGPLPLRLSASFDADYSDNFQRLGGSKVADLSLLPRLDLSGTLRLSSNLTLTLGLGVGYITYLNHTQKDRVLTLASLAPETGLSLDVKIGHFLINLHERPDVPRYQAESVTQRNQSQFSSFTNTAGVTVLWDVNSQTSATFRYDHTNETAIASSNSSVDRVEDQFLASLSRKLSDSLGVGIEAGSTVIKYKEAFLNNGTTYQAGAFITWKASDYLNLQVAGGYQGGSYDSSGSNGDSSNMGSYYANVSISNNLNRYYSHSLSFGHQAQRGTVSNFVETDYVRYSAGWDVIHPVRLGLFVSFEDVKESGGIFAQHLRQYSAGVSCGCQLTKHIALTLSCEFTKREPVGGSAPSGNDSLAFDENRASLRIGYTF